MIYSMLVPILFPVIAGLFLLVMKEPKKRKVLLGITEAALLATGAFVVHALFRVNGKDVILFRLTVAIYGSSVSGLDSGGIFRIFLYETGGRNRWKI